MEIIFEMDGNAIMAHWNDFINLQESPCGFGYTIKEAVESLIEADPDTFTLTCV